MSAVTPSEAMLEAFCAQQVFRQSKIAVSAVKTPDYEIVTPSGVLICEVKQFDPNQEEAAARQALLQRKYSVVSSRPGQRVLAAISTAVRQLKRLTNGRLPGVVVLCDPNQLGHGGEYNIRVGMFGFDTLVLGIPSNPAAPPRLIGRKSGPGRRMTPAHCTSISAVADLRRTQNGDFELDVYHNHFAAIPLDPAVLHSKGVRQFKLAESEASRFDTWVQVNVA